MPLMRRIPKRGFTNIFRQTWTIVNLRDLNRFPAEAVVDKAALTGSRPGEKPGASGSSSWARER